MICNLILPSFPFSTITEEVQTAILSWGSSIFSLQAWWFLLFLCFSFLFLDNIYEGNYSRDHEAEKTMGKNLNITRWYKGLKLKNPSLNLHLNLLTIEQVIAYIVMTGQGGRFPLINWKFPTNIAPNVISSLHFFQKREQILEPSFLLLVGAGSETIAP